MRFQLDEDQAMIAESVRRMFNETFDRTAIDRFARDGVIRDAWRALVGGSGLLGICAPPACGGLAMGAVGALAIAEAAGAHTVPFPIAEGIAAAAALAEHPSLAMRVIAGHAIVAIATPKGLTAEPAADGYRLSGDAGPVPWADRAEAMLIEAAGPDGNALRLIVRLSGPGVRMTARTGIDPTTPVAQVMLDEATAVSAGPADPAWHRLRAILAAAEMQGAARAALELAVAYMKERRQFGQEIGKFQALKHIAAGDALGVENMALADAYAAWAHDAGSDDADAALHIAQAYASETARTVAEDSIQCHGGIGFTWDYGLHFLLRRILRLAASFGTAAEHREALTAGLVAAHA